MIHFQYLFCANFSRYSLYKANSFRSKPHQEQWYNTYVWSTIIDMYFPIVASSSSFDFERGEISCVLQGIRKNRLRFELLDDHTPQKRGCYMDGVIKGHGENALEYGAVECAKSFHGGNSSTKSIDTIIKLSHAMRDMLFRLHEKVDHDAELIPRLQVVGISTAGLGFQLFRMYSPKGYVSFFEKEDVFGVPPDFDPVPICLLLGHVLQMMVSLHLPSISSLTKPLDDSGTNSIDYRQPFQ